MLDCHQYGFPIPRNLYLLSVKHVGDPENPLPLLHLGCIQVEACALLVQTYAM